MTDTYYARVDITYESGDSIFTIPFSYIKEEHIRVFVNDIETKNFVFNTISQIQINDELIAGDLIKIIRQTPIDARMVSFTNTSILNKDNQNLSAQQIFNVVQELYDENAQFKIDVDNIIEENNDEINQNFEDFTNEINSTISEVNEAAELIDTTIATVEGAVETCTQMAATATTQANNATEKAQEAAQQAVLATQKAQEATQALENCADINLSNISDEGIEVIRQSSCGSYVGAIIKVNATSFYVPENMLYANGSTHTKGEFPDTYTDWLVGGRIETCTFEEFNQSVAQTGECWLWGLDTATEKFRVPKIKDIVVRGSANSVPAKGNGKGMVITDGTTEATLMWPSGGNQGHAVSTVNNVGDNIGTSTTWDYSGINTNKVVGLTTDPTKSGIVTDTSDLLVTQTIKHFVVVATGSINQSEMDWSAWASGLDSKVNVSDMVEIPAIIDTYTNGANGYIVYSNGLCEQWGKSVEPMSTSVSISLLKNYKDTNYFVVATISGSNSKTTGATNVTSKTISSFNTESNYTAYANRDIDWFTTGYIS